MWVLEALGSSQLLRSLVGSSLQGLQRNYTPKPSPPKAPFVLPTTPCWKTMSSESWKQGAPLSRTEIEAGFRVACLSTTQTAKITVTVLGFALDKSRTSYCNLGLLRGWCICRSCFLGDDKAVGVASLSPFGLLPPPPTSGLQLGQELKAPKPRQKGTPRKM